MQGFKEIVANIARNAIAYAPYLKEANEIVDLINAQPGCRAQTIMFGNRLSLFVECYSVGEIPNFLDWSSGMKALGIDVASPEEAKSVFENATIVLGLLRAVQNSSPSALSGVVFYEASGVAKRAQKIQMRIDSLEDQLEEARTELRSLKKGFLAGSLDQIIGDRLEAT